MKKNIFGLCFIINFCLNAQVGINSTSPSASLDVVATNPTGTATSIDGILIPRVDRQRAQSMTTIPNATVIYVNSIATGTATGIAANINSVGFYAFDTTVLPAPGRWIQFQTTASGWNTTGNSGTNPATNYLGTTDATDLVLRTNNTERLRINNAMSAVTGTSGDVSVGDANNGTIKSNREFVIRQDGDTFGSSVLRLRNRNAENGAIFENLNPTPAGTNLVDFIFKTGTTATPIQSNIRFETRASSRKVTGNTTEWQFGQPDTLNGGPTLVIGANGTGSQSSFLIGNLGVGTANPTGKLHINETTGTAHGANQGSLIIDHQNSGGTSSIVFPSRVNNGSDYGYISYSDNASGNGTTAENSLLEIGVENDGLTGDQDDIAIMPTGNLGIGTRAPKAKLHNEGTTAFTTATSGTNNTILLLNGGTFATPAANANNSGMVYIIRNTGTGGTNVTVNNIINYNATTAANFNLTPTIGSIMIVSNGSNWFRID